ncbi:hypothetical protein JG687_00010930 [Phytophthora cactorum]|uniref:Uncharacterized protein n=1 Tax=Phytophthora cactorum TaxID=29920 RepID=A0A8T1U600_9STRA|nr:hypothetical protein JG687_00010930 [Phytophthora cactorum]
MAFDDIFPDLTMKKRIRSVFFVVYDVRHRRLLPKVREKLKLMPVCLPKSLYSSLQVLSLRQLNLLYHTGCSCASDTARSP